MGRRGASAELPEPRGDRTVPALAVVVPQFRVPRDGELIERHDEI